MGTCQTGNVHRSESCDKSYSQSQSDKDEQEDFCEIVNFDIYNVKESQSKCNGANNKNSMVKQCDYLNRLATALKYYDTLKTSNNKVSQDKFSEFCLETYQDLLDDIHHLQKNHGAKLQEIKAELITKYGCKSCQIQNCVFSQRHYVERTDGDEQKTDILIVYDDENKDPEYTFFEKVMDGVHFNIFHLYDVGLRHKLDMDDIKINDEMDNNGHDCSDHIFCKMRDEIHKKRDKYRRFSRAGMNNSKYHIDLGFDSAPEPKIDNDQKTWIDMMLQNLIDNEMNKGIIGQIQQFLLNEEYDTDVIMEELKGNDNESNMCNAIKNAEFISTIRNYVIYSQLSDRSFNVGLIFFYWPIDGIHQDEMNDYSGYDVTSLYIDKPKYTNLKQEIINSGFCDIRQFNENIALKAQKYMNTATQRKYVAFARVMQDKKGNKHDPMIHSKRESDYNIEPCSYLSISNLQAVIAYCDFSGLCTSFSSSFRAIRPGEPLESVKNRNRSYYWMSKILRETVECFGETGADVFWRKNDIAPGMIFSAPGEIGPFYCGLNTVMIIPSFNARLCGPTSTSKYKEVAVNFATRSGIIMELNNNGNWNDKNNLRCFDCSWLSAYKEEEERLFFGGYRRLRVESVIIVESHQNFGTFFHALFYFDAMIGGSVSGSSYKEYLYQKKMQDDITRKDYNILHHLIQNELGYHGDHQFDNYMYNTFHLFCQKKHMIYFDLHQINSWFDKISDLIMYPIQVDPKRRQWNQKECHVDRNLFRPILFQLFPNVKDITIMTTDVEGYEVFSVSFSSIKRIYSSIASFKTSTTITVIAHHAIPRYRSFHVYDSQTKSKKKTVGISDGCNDDWRPIFYLFPLARWKSDHNDGVFEYHRVHNLNKQKSYVTITKLKTIKQ